ncbi:EAL domain-containing protein [Methylobacterium sp. D54C]
MPNNQASISASSATAGPSSLRERRPGSDEDRIGATTAGRDPHLDAICRTATRLLGVKFAFVSILDGMRQCFIGNEGLPCEETTLDVAFCAWTVRSGPGVPLLVPDTTADPRFAANPLVTGAPYLRFYAGIPLSLAPGACTATVCVADVIPHPDFDDGQICQLQDIAAFVEAHLRLGSANDRLRDELSTRRRLEHALDVQDAASREMRAAEAMAERAACFGRWSLDTATGTIMWSEGLARIFGRVGREAGWLDLDTYLDFHHPEDRASLRAFLYCEAHLGGHASPATQCRSRVQRPDGSVREIIVHAFPGDGTPDPSWRLRGLVVDVTDLARSERGLRETDALLRATLDAMDQGLLMTDADDRVRVRNGRVGEMAGIPEEMLHDGAPFETVRRHQTDQGEFRHLPTGLRHWLETGEPGSRVDDYERERPNGVVLQVRTLPVASGGVVRTFADVTARRGAERALRDSEAHYRALAEALPQLVWVVRDDTGEASYANRRFTDFYGPMGAERAARLARNHPDDAGRMEAAWTSARDRQAGYAVEGRLRRHDGTYRWHKLVMDPVHLGNAVVEWIGTALDIDDLVTARQHLQETTDLLSLAQDAAGAGVWEWDVGGMVRLSAPGARLLGLDGADGMPVVLSLDEWKALIWPEDGPNLWGAVKAALATRTPFASEFRVRARNGRHHPIWLQTFGHVVVDEHGGEPVRIVGLYLDVTTRRRTEEALRISEERLALALDSGEDCLFDWDLTSGAVWVTERWREKLGLNGVRARPGLSGWAEAVHPEDRERVAVATRAHLTGASASLECEYRVRIAGKQDFWVLARARVSNRSKTGRALRLVGTLIDITGRKEAEARVEHMALHDALTGLPNRVLFRHRLDRLLQQDATVFGRQAVLACDLDRFKAINDTFGHIVGDRVLCLVAERIRGVLRVQDTVARLGGDEFAVILSDVDGEAAVGHVCERILSAIDEPFTVDHAAIDIGASIGVAFVGGDATVEEIFQRADVALFEAKAAGRNTYRLSEAEAYARTATRSLLALDMKEAIRRRDFFLVYQPIVDARTDTVVCFEALMRWRHPERGLVSPADFIPLAEETGLIVQLGAWALAEACREARRWPGDIRVAVNVSTVQLRDGLEEAVISAVAGAGLEAGRLTLEVTESVLMRDADDALARLHRLREFGVRVALDDFGTGYSSLSYLRRFPFDRIKLDRAFIRDIAEPDAAAIVRAVVDLSGRLGKGIVAEGVETDEQLERLRREGCTEMQGYLFSKPLAAVDALAFVEDRGRRTAA